MEKAWLGVDAGKESHWACMLDASGAVLLSRRVENEEADLSNLIEDALLLAEEVVWAVDQPGGGAALLLALLWERNQRESSTSPGSRRLPWRVQNRCPRCPCHCLPQARMRPDLGELKLGEEELAELQLLLARRRDLITDQSRTITRLRETLVSLFLRLWSGLWI
jgi:hypothetical protein